MSNFPSEFQRLLADLPRYNVKHVMAENCDYSDTAVKSKNCYYSFCVFYCEDVYYGRYSRKCVSCSGVTLCADCQWCTECVDCVGCYEADYCQDCQNCKQCTFCRDCFGCTDCFGCCGLYQKQYCIFNEQLTKEAYQARMQELNLENDQHRNLVRQKLEDLRKNTPNLGCHQFQTENCIGDHISESKGCTHCYDIFASEDCLYNVEANGNKDCCDITVCFESERCYQCVQSPLCYDSNFLMHCDQCKQSEFCAYSKNLTNCFGCVYLENKEYHILNQPVDPAIYPQEIEHIRKELQAENKYNLELFFVSEYERNRLKTETDSPISVQLSL